MTVNIFLKAKFVILSTFIILCPLSFNITAQTQSKEVLRQRVDLFYKYFSENEFDKMWNLTSEDFRKKWDNEKNEYISNLEQFRDAEIKVCIKGIEIENNKAIIRVRFSFWLKNKKHWIHEKNKNVWIYENNNWFFKSQNEK